MQLASAGMGQIPSNFKSHCLLYGFESEDSDSEEWWSQEVSVDADEEEDDEVMWPLQRSDDPQEFECCRRTVVFDENYTDRFDREEDSDSDWTPIDGDDGAETDVDGDEEKDMVEDEEALEPEVNMVEGEEALEPELSMVEDEEALEPEGKMVEGDEALEPPAKVRRTMPRSFAQ